MDILKKIKEIDIASRCNNRVFYENLIAWFDYNFAADDDCSIYQFVKSTQNDCKACISENFRLGDTLCYYPFRLRVLAEYDLITWKEYSDDLYDLSNGNISMDDCVMISRAVFTSPLLISKNVLRDKCLELWEKKLNGHNGNNQPSESSDSETRED